MCTAKPPHAGTCVRPRSRGAATQTCIKGCIWFIHEEIAWSVHEERRGGRCSVPSARGQYTRRFINENQFATRAPKVDRFVPHTQHAAPKLTDLYRKPSIAHHTQVRVMGRKPNFFYANQQISQTGRGRGRERERQRERQEKIDGERGTRGAGTRNCTRAWVSVCLQG